MRMTEAEFENEKRYQGLVYFLKQMLRDGLISEDEYCQLCTEYAQRFSPKTGTLLARNNLLCGPFRVMNGAGKEAKTFENQQD